MDWNRIQRIWQSENRRLEENPPLGKDELAMLMQNRSNNILNRLRGEMNIAIAGVGLCLVVFGIYWVRFFTDPILSISSGLMVISSVFFLAWIIRQRLAFGRLELGINSLQNTIHKVIELIENHFSKSRLMGAFLAPLACWTGVLVDQKIEMGALHISWKKLFAFCVLMGLLVAFSFWTSRQKIAETTSDLNACLAHLVDKEAPLPPKRLRFTLAHGIFLVVIGGLLVYLLSHT